MVLAGLLEGLEERLEGHVNHLTNEGTTSMESYISGRVGNIQSQMQGVCRVSAS